MINLRIKEICSQKGITQKVLSEMIGVSTTSLSRIITNEQKPSLDTLEKIASALGVEVYELFAPDNSKEGIIHCPHCGKQISLTPKI